MSSSQTNGVDTEILARARAAVTSTDGLSLEESIRRAREAVERVRARTTKHGKR